MSAKEHLIARFKALCKAEGGPAEIAAATGLSAESLAQIFRGTKLKSGEPRGVGPAVQKVLDEHYPGWSALGPEDAPSEAWPFEMISRDRWDRLSERQRGAVERSMLDVIEKIEEVPPEIVSRKAVRA